MNNYSYESRLHRQQWLFRWRSWHIDPPLMILLLFLGGIGLLILYSASNENTGIVLKQSMRLFISFVVMFAFSQISPKRYYHFAPWFFVTSLFFLVGVLLMGKMSGGVRRWFDLGIINVQPSELMKLAMPMILAYFFSDKSVPPRITQLLLAGMLIIIPVFLTAKEPDLGTAIVIATSGFFVLLLAGLSWRLLFGGLMVMASFTPILWHFMHHYQRERILTFLNPERDPLGAGYHIIQSKIAVGSGGFLGKGWLQGTQSHFQFLPAHTTDFIFAVGSEELGLVGCCIIILLLLVILGRCLYISLNAKDAFSYLLAGSLSLTFIFSALINICMVIGILPVVGIPLPLISYGGSSMITLMASFGIIVSIQTHQKLWP